MTREEFERLLSDWLDEPLRADLHDLMESACAQSPELIALRDAWRNVHAMTRETPPALRDVDWRAQHERIRSTIDGEIAAVMSPGKREIEELVELALPTIGVDWTQQREQIAARLDAHIAQELRPGALDNVLRETDPAEVNWRAERDRIAAATTRRLRLWKLSGLAAGVTAAAAAVALFMLRPTASQPGSTPENIDSAIVIVDAPPAPLTDGDAFEANVAVSAPDEVDIAATDAAGESDETSELYFSIEPALTLAAGS